MKNQLYRSKKNRVLMGLCGGLGEFFGIDPLAFRVIFVIFSGAGIWVYLILCAFIPEK